MDERPPVWIGHMLLKVADIEKSKDYWIGLGMRHIASGDGFSVLELRGGTHIVLLPSEEPIEPGTPTPFDLMVEDIDATRKEFEERGLAPSKMVEGNIHHSFTVRDPSGYDVTFNSTHVSDQPV